MIVGIYVWYSVYPPIPSNCKAEIKYAATGLKNRVQDAVKGNDTTLTFSPPTCYGEQTETIQLKVLNSEPLCNYYCGGTKRECLVFSYEAEGKYSEIQCLESASVQTTFFTDDPDICPPRDGYELVDFKNAIVRGSYNIISKSTIDSEYPRLCAYRRLP
ncbi:MAG: hypothetical protein Q7R47_07110 [Candidatus Diapherotrites archaeon]|nr:hypothetical protein [Candidatus Diapherotrites archaeon]